MTKEERDVLRPMLYEYVRSVTGEDGRVCKNDIMFHSPLRNDKNASFSVNPFYNIWYDYGTGKHGDVIDLVMKVEGVDFNGAKSFLLSGNFSTPPPTPSPATIITNTTNNNTPLMHKVDVITSPALIDYAQKRGVNVDVLKHYCKEVTINCKYFYIGFPTDSDGWELRNGTKSQYAKSCIGKKSISTIITGEGNSEVMVFEGFFDWLAFASVATVSRQDVIVLNSTTNTATALPKLAKYTTVHCYTDNDTAGVGAYQMMVANHPHVISHTSHFREGEDVNDYILRLGKNSLRNRGKKA